MARKAVRAVPAVYEDGVFRPLEPLELVEHSVVHLRILESETDESSESLRAMAIRLLGEAGLVTLPNQPREDELAPISPERRAELGRLFSTGDALSEQIIADRGSR